MGAVTASATTLAPLPTRFARLVKIEHTVFALPFAYVGAFLAVGGTPSGHDLLWITLAMVGARSLAMALNRLIDAGIDARNPRTADARAAERPAVDPAGRALLRAVARALPRRRLAARAEDALALADSRRGLRRLPVPQALHLALPLLARRGRRARAGRRLGGDHEPPSVGGVAARRRGRTLGRRLRPLLRAVRRRGRSRAAFALDRDEVRRARRIRRRAARACRDRRVPRCRRARPAGRRSLLDRRRRRRRRCSHTSTRSSAPTISAGSTRRSSR